MGFLNNINVSSFSDDLVCITYRKDSNHTIKVDIDSSSDSAISFNYNGSNMVLSAEKDTPFHSVAINRFTNYNSILIASLATSVYITTTIYDLDNEPGYVVVCDNCIYYFTQKFNFIRRFTNNVQKGEIELSGNISLLHIGRTGSKNYPTSHINGLQVYMHHLVYALFKFDEYILGVATGRLEVNHKWIVFNDNPASKYALMEESYYLPNLELCTRQENKRHSVVINRLHNYVDLSDIKFTMSVIEAFKLFDYKNVKSVCYDDDFVYITLSRDVTDDTDTAEVKLERVN